MTQNEGEESPVLAQAGTEASGDLHIVYAPQAKKACENCGPKAYLGEVDGIHYFQCSCGRNFTGDRSDLNEFLARTLRDTPPNEGKIRGVQA